MSLNDYPQETRLNESIFHFISSLLVAAMLTCVMLTIGSLMGRILPTWQPGAMAVVAFFVALDHLYTYKRLKTAAIFSSEWFVGYGTQLVVIVALLKIVTGLANGPDAFLAEIPRWADNFANSFFTPNFVAALVIVFFIWVLSGSFATLLDEMGLQQALILLDTISAAPTDQPPARERLLGLVFSVCAFLVFITGLMRVNLRALSSGSGETLFFNLPPLAGGGASTLVYFMLGLALLSQTQFMDLNTRWSLARIPVSGKLAGRWAFYSLVFLAILAAFASLLPTNYSLGLLAVLSYLFGVIFFLIQMVLSALIFLVSLPFLFLGRQPPLLDPIPPQMPSIPEALGQAAANAPIPWLELLKSVLFWVALLGIIVFAFIQYARQHQDLLRKLPGWVFWSKAWAWLRSLFGGIQTGLAKAVESGLERLRARRGTARDGFPSGFLNLRRLDPRQRIYFFYLALIRRSGESGLPRSLSQTPSEFAAALDRALPEAEPDIDALTAAFIEARYSRHPVEPKHANLVKATWERLRKAFRGKKVESGK